MDIQEFLEKVREDPQFTQFIASKRVRLFSILHEIVFFGKGGYDFFTVYALPIWLRNYIYREIREYYAKEAETMGQSGGTTGDLKSEVAMPEQVREKIATSHKKSDLSFKTKRK